MILKLSQEHGTIILVILEDSRVGPEDTCVIQSEKHTWGRLPPVIDHGGQLDLHSLSFDKDPT